MNIWPDYRVDRPPRFDFEAFIADLCKIKRDRIMTAIPPGALIKTNPELFTPIRKKRR